jgi:PTS system mannose-specific IIB component/fructoselysine and glucoselysine-specific PTS system IIB component
MPITLCRIDERLLHGQVIVGWGKRLGLGFYVVVDDHIAKSDWERELYASALPEGIHSFFMTTDEAIDLLTELDSRADSGMVLTSGTRTMRRLAEASVLNGKPVNIGGLHAAPGRERLLDYVFLSRDEMEDVKALLDLVGSVTARDLPGSAQISAARLLRTVERARG